MQWDGVKTVELTVPAENEMMICVRLTTSGVVSRVRNLTLDAAEDVKMAVEEACICLIKFSGCNLLSISYEIGASQLQVNVQAECHGMTPQCPSADELQTIRFILESFVDGVKLCGKDEGLTRITLQKTLS